MMRLQKPDSKARGIFRVLGATSSGCAKILTEILYSLEGITDVKINHVTDHVYVEYDPAKISSEQIKKNIAKVGYGAVETEGNSLIDKNGHRHEV